MANKDPKPFDHKIIVSNDEAFLPGEIIRTQRSSAGSLPVVFRVEHLKPDGQFKQALCDNAVKKDEAGVQLEDAGAGLVLTFLPENPASRAMVIGQIRVTDPDDRGETVVFVAEDDGGPFAPEG